MEVVYSESDPKKCGVGRVNQGNRKDKMAFNRACFLEVASASIWG